MFCSDESCDQFSIWSEKTREHTTNARSWNAAKVAERFFTEFGEILNRV
jgi:hypothetical protein